MEAVAHEREAPGMLQHVVVAVAARRLVNRVDGHWYS